jgi:hypothetical protein
MVIVTPTSIASGLQNNFGDQNVTLRASKDRFPISTFLRQPAFLRLSEVTVTRGPRPFAIPHFRKLHTLIKWVSTFSLYLPL